MGKTLSRAALAVLALLIAFPAAAVDRKLIKTMDVDQLARLLANDPSAATRRYAAEVLGKWHSEKSVPALAAAAAGDQSPKVRVAALRALAESGEAPKATEAFQKAMGDPDPGVREAALEIAIRQRVPGLGDKLCELLGDASEEVRDTALFGLTAVRKPSSATCLLDRLPSISKAGKRVEYVRAIREIGAKEAAVPLAKAVENDAPAVQEEALLAFLALGDPAVVPTLERMRDQAKSARLISRIQTTITALKE